MTTTTSAGGDRPPVSACLYCWRKGRWPGWYCSPEHEARAAVPDGVDLTDRRPARRMGGRRWGW